MSALIHPSLAACRALFDDLIDLPYCNGTVPLHQDALFYQLTADTAGRIEFHNPSEDQLSALADACQKATFGLNQKDVLDESYRKAGKMDASEFATLFSPHDSGIVDIIRDSLLHGANIENTLVVEPYKLNVYGPGSFFKAHVDTPRSDEMFGSLVVVLPTVHEGGSLVLRHNGQERTFDTAREVLPRPSRACPHVAFVAFYSDVEHEVSVVTSGYRVTLTYNLYLIDHPSVKSELGIGPDPEAVEKMKIALELLTHLKAFSQGGVLGFGLSHKYPFNPNTTSLEDIQGRLKGSDAQTWSLCKALSLNVSLKAVYQDQEEEEYSQIGITCLLDHFADLDRGLINGEAVEDNILDHLRYHHEGVWFYDIEKCATNEYVVPPILWVKPRGESNTFQQLYMAYGNEPSPDHAYGKVCLVVEIGDLRKRRRSISP